MPEQTKDKPTPKKAAPKRKKTQKEIAEAALETKRSNSDTSTKPPTEKAREGMRPLPNDEIAPSGALEQEGHRPVLERSRKVR
jgi:hypothetical protein